ncbi:MAG: S9 family peptidase, partial [Anaerolineae bacterium]|nr:S9 family peptidase [Anaerolineae bacterium]
SITGALTDLLPAPYNARTRVHEYGGGSYTVHDGIVYFSNFADQRLYRLAPGAAPIPLTPETDIPAVLRYADGVVDAERGLMFCVREDHRGGGEAVNTLVRLPLDGGLHEGTPIASGADFYATPRLSPDGSRLTWLTWDHPNMPWDGAVLWLADVTPEGNLVNARQIAGGVNESIFQPAWSPGGELTFVSDRTGWWNLYRWAGGEASIILKMEAEFGRPLWVFGMATYAFASPETVYCVFTQDGVEHLARLDIHTGALDVLDLPYTQFGAPGVGAVGLALTAGSPTEATAVVRIDPDAVSVDVLKRSTDLVIDPSYLSEPEPLEFPTGNGLTAHALYYRPQNRDFTAPAGEKPPLVVVSHGGPTGATSSTLNLSLQYWTSRGFAVLDVNYGGSVGYGRAYRERLNGNWGIVDVADCVNGARYLAAQGEVDGERLVIHGGSAGGYTTLCALTFYDTFKAGASFFGVADAEALAQETHKFESRYLDSLIGPYPEQRDVYVARSPIHFTDRLSCPVIFFQGLEDKVVPPSQAEMMVAALREKGIPVAYIAYKGEQHGFRRAENIKRTLDAELYFYGQIFGFEPADSIEPVAIENL